MFTHCVNSTAEELANSNETDDLYNDQNNIMCVVPAAHELSGAHALLVVCISTHTHKYVECSVDELVVDY